MDVLKSIVQLEKNINLILYVKKYITLKKNGDYYLGMCPFHKENIPSFYIKQNIYKCFGCGQRGGVVDFLSKVTFKSKLSIVKYLKNKHNFKSSSGNIDFYSNRKYIRYQYILDTVNIYCKKNLILKSSTALKYLLKHRKIDLLTVKKYGLGFGGDNNYLFFKFCRTNNIFLSELKHIKVIKFYKKWNFCFINRITFPVKNVNGDIISFTGRSIFYNKYQSSKYLHIQNTNLSRKSNAIFGIYESLNCGGTDIFIVEGNFDVLSLHQFGISSVATSGVYLKFFHAKMLCKYFSKIIVCVDYDKSGKKFAINLLILFLKVNIILFLIKTPFKDANLLLQLKNQNFMFKYKNTAINFLDFLIRENHTTFRIERGVNSPIVSNIIFLIKYIRCEFIQNFYLSKLKFYIFKKVSDYFYTKEITNTTKMSNTNSIDYSVLRKVIEYKSDITCYDKFINLLATCSSLLKKIIILYRMHLIFKQYNSYIFILNNLFIYIIQSSHRRTIFKNYTQNKLEIKKYTKDQYCNNIYLIFKDILKY